MKIVELENVSSGGSGRIPVPVKVSAMRELIGAQTNLKIGISSEPITRAEQQTLTKGKWELHNPIKDGSGNVVKYDSRKNRVVFNSKGEPVTILSVTQLVYFAEHFADRLTTAHREKVFEILKAFEGKKSSELGDASGSGHEALARVLAMFRKAKQPKA